MARTPSVRGDGVARAVAVLVAAVLLTGACGGTVDDRAGTATASAPVDGEAATALDFSAPTLAGERLDVSTLAGEPVVLWFWAPWCTICRTEAPEVAQVAQELADDVTVLGVAGRGPTADMRAFVEDTGTGDLQHLVDADGSLWQRFAVVTQPAYAFVSPEGEVELFAGGLGADELRTRVAALSAS